jgi:hypothetical protein
LFEILYVSRVAECTAKSLSSIDEVLAGIVVGLGAEAGLSGNILKQTKVVGKAKKLLVLPSVSVLNSFLYHKA